MSKSHSINLNEMKYKFQNLNIKLSYDTIIHKKVLNYNMVFAIPHGKKCFMWFCMCNGKSTCLMVEMDYNNKKMVKFIKPIQTSFSSILCEDRGTIFYGTWFEHLGNSFFSMEELVMYKGKSVFFQYGELISKINKLCFILKNELNQVSYNQTYIVFGLPIIAHKEHDNIDQILGTISYKLNALKYCNHSGAYIMPIKYYFEKENEIKQEKTQINALQDVFMPKQYKSFEKNNNNNTIHNNTIHNKNNANNNNIHNNNTIHTNTIHNTINKNNKQYKKRLIVKPDIQCDVYHLYERDTYIGIACIPDYKTSIWMNDLFRKIKENRNMDFLEESDDEEEFENVDVDKFVYLNKQYYIECIFNYKFKKWIPSKLV